MIDNSTAGGFQDPLENYDPKSYTDPLERALAEERVKQIRHQPHASVGPDTTVRDAIRKLASEHVACLLVEDDGGLVGMFTNREVLNRVALEPQLLDGNVRDVMTTDPICVRENDPVAATLCVMAQFGYRHVPVIDDDSRAVGIVSPQRVTQFLCKQLEK